MEPKGCVHHWTIEIANGPKSKGVCLNCGMKKSFTNSVGDLININQSSKPRNSKIAGESYGYLQVKNDARNKIPRIGITLDQEPKEYKRYD